VNVSGEVKNPGVYSHSPESRVQDTIQAAGGVTTQGNSSGLNLAALLEDGIRVQVPAQTPTETPAPITGTNAKEQQNSSQPTSPPVQSSSTLININTASQEELETLSGIGPATALKIIALREENDSFTSIEEIQKVSGIGPAAFEKIKDFITVNGEP
jgi:competence protein ComEA